MDQERSREIERRLQEREAAKEDHARELERQAGECKLLELQLRVQELQQPSQAVTADSSDREASNQGFRSPHKLIPAFNEARDELDAYIHRFERVARVWPSEKLLGYFDHWQYLDKTEKTYDALRNKAVSSQFLRRCDQKLAIFRKDEGSKGLDSLAETADHYLEAQGLTNLARGREEKVYVKSGRQANEPSSGQAKPFCFICNKRGHKPSDCWSRTSGSKAATGWKGKKPGHGSEGFTKNPKDRNEASCSLSERGQPTEEDGRQEESTHAVNTEDRSSEKIGSGAEST
ncbi:hypothetical protein HPB49_014314 [Dermacentor silvarum]|uniref:Uncharacterized protein n=1 Tax=Dermacentor silvarum TaxID=543639 RepID=A0ACB8CL92_DERSI|nr:hypothetical protein HPB49_014314 [Dermacentor silvarum]